MTNTRKLLHQLPQHTIRKSILKRVINYSNQAYQSRLLDFHITQTSHWTCHPSIPYLCSACLPKPGTVHSVNKPPYQSDGIFSLDLRDGRKEVFEPIKQSYIPTVPVQLKDLLGHLNVKAVNSTMPRHWVLVFFLQQIHKNAFSISRCKFASLN